jgi:hypothetical protein
VRYGVILLRQVREYKKIEQKLLEDKNSGTQQLLIKIETESQLKIDLFNAGMVELGDVGDIPNFLDMI